jgi:O-antigen/teichoic acid export membrane protein
MPVLERPPAPAPGEAPARRRSVLSHGLPVVVQAGGSAAGFLIVVLVSHRFGIEAQGRFGLLKSWADAISVALMFGLPQALLHLSYHGAAPLARLRGFAQAYAVGLLWAALPLAALAWFSPWPWLAWAVLAAPGFVFHGLLRSLLLRASGPLAYAWVTVSPALLLLVAVAGLAVLPAGADAFGPALLASAVACGLVVVWVAGRAGIGSERTTPLAGVGSVNRHAFVQNACAAAQTALLLSLVAWLVATPTAVGETSFALVFAQLFALAASFMAPLVYDAVARAAPPTGDLAGAGAGAGAGASASAKAHAGLRAALRRLRFVLPALVLLAIVAVPAVVTLVFAAPYASATLACQVMAVAGTLMLANRLAATVLQAQGAFAELTRQAVARLVLSLLLAAVLCALLRWPAALAVGGALLLSEAVLGLRLWMVLRRGLATPTVPWPASGPAA